MDLKRILRNGNYYYFGDAPIHTTGVSLNKSSISLTTVGQTEQLTATVTPADAVDTKVTWSSSDTSIATVDDTGLVTCVTPGSCTITATCDGITAVCGVVLPYLGFIANNANSTVQLNQIGTPTSVTLETSTDGTSWSSYTIGDTLTLSNVGDIVYMRNTSETDTGFNINYSNRYQFVMSGSIAASGDVTTLLNKNGTTTLSVSECFTYLFQNCTSLTVCPNLPATTLSQSCYTYMFDGCTSIITCPELPATTMAPGCYYQMFGNCTSLTTVPELPATTLANDCYGQMFVYCTALNTLPNLPATGALPQGCYGYMFYGSTSIKLSTTQTGEYQTPYIIPKTGTASAGHNPVYYMFGNTGGTFTGAPSLNTTYYTSNTLVG